MATFLWAKVYYIDLDLVRVDLYSTTEYYCGGLTSIDFIMTMTCVTCVVKSSQVKSKPEGQALLFKYVSRIV